MAHQVVARDASTLTRVWETPSDPLPPRGGRRQEASIHSMAYASQCTKFGSHLSAQQDVSSRVVDFGSTEKRKAPRIALDPYVSSGAALPPLLIKRVGALNGGQLLV